MRKRSLFFENRMRESITARAALLVIVLLMLSARIAFTQATEPQPSPSAAELLTTPVMDEENATEDTSAPPVPTATFPAQDGGRQSTAAITIPENSEVTPSLNLTVNLINRLVERGVLTKKDAEDLLRQAQEDVTRAQEAAAAKVAPTPPPPAEDEVRVTYVPEVVKAQIRNEIKEEVMNQAREEHWAAPNNMPEWVDRFRLFGDLRVRYEGDFYPSGNDNTGAFPNFNAINTGPPFDVTGTVFSPQINADQDRNRFRLRARAGAAVTLGDGMTVGLRVATGEDNSPVTTNQTLGVANQRQGGNFSKFDIWLDRAFISYEVGGTPEGDFLVEVGRFDNPFFSTTMIWDDDLGFDGLAVRGRYEVVKGITPFAVAGAFPVFNTDLNFSTNRPDKFPSEDKYLYGGQAGVTWVINKDFTLKGATAYYYFDDVAGRLSDPFVPLTTSDNGNTDDSRPAFAQKGNTYFPIRNIIPTADNNFGTTKQFQYFGLATSFHELAVTGRLDFSHYDPVHFALEGEFVTNLAFDAGRINQIAVNNRGPDTAAGTPGPFDGGNDAFIIQLLAGAPALEKRWDWNVAAGYRYVESDALVDGFVDSDFGLGGTNLKGYTLSASVALSPHFWATLRWMSANSIVGPTFKNDIVQFDLNARF